MDRQNQSLNPAAYARGKYYIILSSSCSALWFGANKAHILRRGRGYPNTLQLQLSNFMGGGVLAQSFCKQSGGGGGGGGGKGRCFAQNFWGEGGGGMHPDNPVKPWCGLWKAPIQSQ